MIGIRGRIFSFRLFLSLLDREVGFGARLTTIIILGSLAQNLSLKEARPMTKKILFILNPVRSSDQVSFDEPVESIIILITFSSRWCA